MPENLPVNTTIAIELVEEPPHIRELVKAGEVVKVDLNLPENFKGDLEFILELAYDSNENVAIYYLNEETEDWELIGGDMNPETKTISVNVTHFSTYGVFEYDPIIEEPETDEPGTKGPDTDEPATDEREDGNEEGNYSELPDTATSLYNYMFVGLLLAISGVSLYLLQKRRKVTV